jgi:hypothetical protein
MVVGKNLRLLIKPKRGGDSKNNKEHKTKL